MNENFTLGSKSAVSLAGAIEAANELEKVVGEIAKGKRKASMIPIEPMAVLAQFVRDSAASVVAVPPLPDVDVEHERPKFEAQMRNSDPSGILTFNFSRHEVSQGYAGYVDKSTESAFCGWILAKRARA